MSHAFWNGFWTLTRSHSSFCQMQPVMHSWSWVDTLIILLNHRNWGCHIQSHTPLKSFVFKSKSLLPRCLLPRWFIFDLKIRAVIFISCLFWLVYTVPCRTKMVLPVMYKLFARIIRNGNDDTWLSLPLRQVMDAGILVYYIVNIDISSCMIFMFFKRLVWL